MPDFIPNADSDFNEMAVNLNTSVTDPANPLQLATTLITRFTTAFGAWTPAWTAWGFLAPQINAKLQTKDSTRLALDGVIREVNAAAQANPAVTAAQKAAADLPVHKTTRTPVGEISTSPQLQRVDNEHLLQRLWFVDSATPTSKARPAGAAFCEIRQLIVAAGGAAPTDPAAMPFLATDTKPPYRADFDGSDVGKTAYYALRWVNTKSEPGPWGAISGYLIN